MMLLSLVILSLIILPMQASCNVRVPFRPPTAIYTLIAPLSVMNQFTNIR